jgi:hypothetical protein
MTTTINASTSAGLVQTADTSGSLALQTAGTTAVTIDTSQKVGIGTTSPTGILNVKGTGGDALPATSGSTQSAGLITRLQQGGGIGSVMDIGGNGGTGSWIQVTEPSNLATNYNLMLNPNGGNVGIGTTSPSEKLHVQTAGNVQIRLQATGANYVTYGLYNSSKNYSMQIRTDQSNAWVLRDETAGANRIMVRDSDGVIFIPSVYATTNAAAANVYVGSDGFLGRSTSSLKYKRDVQDATHGLADVLKLRSVTFKSKSESNGDLVFGGFIAEEVDALGLTEFVQYADDESPDALAYGNMVALLTKAIQEQQALITAQAETLSQQATLINALTARIEALENK